ncbi:MAG: hypothetical protein M3A44_05880 [Gammaproteobacteria bacterium]
MSMKLKVLAAAVALAAAGQAAAAIQDGTNGNGELFLSVWDSVGQQSYIRGLDTLMNDFGTVNAPAAASFTANVDATPGFTKSWVADSTWSTFVAGKSAADIANFKWDVAALDSVGTSGAHQQRYLTTTNEDLTAWPTTAGVQQNNANISNMSIVNTALQTANLTLGASKSGIFTSGNAYYAGLKNEAMSGKASFNTNSNVGTALEFYYLTRSSSTASAEALQFKYGSADSKAQFMLGADGNLNYTVAAVPEAETWAMFAMGLLAVGAVARRRLSA